MSQFKNIKNRNELAEFLGIPLHILTHILYVKKVDNLYSSFEIPKKNGEPRSINAPFTELKSIQKKLADALWEHQKYLRLNNRVNTKMSHAFEKNKSIITNAEIHRNRRYVLNLDLENFFDSIHFGRVKGYFEKNRELQLSSQVSTVIAQLLCFKGCLPQGSPASPIITNVICNVLDIRLLNICRKYKLNYTRYADDMTFSTNDKLFLNKIEDLFEDLSKEIEKSGFKINSKKTRLQYKNSKQVVTGLIVNQKINVDRNFYKYTRAMAHTLYKEGSFELNDKIGTINQLEGRFSFINQLEKYNNKLDGKKHNFYGLNSKEKQFQKFLFYKYFYANQKPIIVTEGKTDVTYLKSALKNLYKEYPNLITRNPNGSFVFKLTFLKKTKRLKYFLNIHPDGADTMKNIYYYYSTDSKNSNQNYWEEFNKMGTFKKNKPVFLIFDNEISNSSKPIHHFITHTKLSDAKKSDLINNLYVNIIGNLYLTTNPLIDGKKECEIEDLFEESVLLTNINGKIFSKSKKYDTNKCYGKEVFSNYIHENYEKINFSNFKILLDNINQIITS